MKVQKRTPRPPVRKSYGPIQTSLKLGDFPVEKTENRESTYFSRIRHWVLNCRWSAAEFGPIRAMAPFQPRRVGSMLQGGTTTGESGTKVSSGSRIGSKNKEFVKILETGHPTIKCYQKEKDTIDGRGSSKTSEELIRRLLEMTQSPLPDHRYDGDDLFLSTLERLDGKSERKVQHSLHDLICPQAEALADRITDPELRRKYDLLVDAMDEQWNHRAAIFKEDKSKNQDPLAMPRPDYIVGFDATKFSDDQTRKLVKAFGDNSKWCPMSRVCFPFLACEAKHMNGLDNADNQNAHSMTLAIMAVVDFFKRAQCEWTIHREILGFSISYNHKIALLYGHYPVLLGPRTEIHRTPIDVHVLNGYRYRDRWKSYRFVRSVYEEWAPMHFKRLCDAIDRINANLSVSSLSSNDFGTELANRLVERLETQGPSFLVLSDDDRTIQGDRPTPPPQSPPPVPPPPPPPPRAPGRYQLRSHQPPGVGTAREQPSDHAPSVVESADNNSPDGPRKRQKRNPKRSRAYVGN